MRLNKIVQTDLSKGSQALGMKKAEEESGLIAVQLGDAVTRSIKIMAFDSDTLTTPVEIYHYKAKHGESKYREIGLDSDIYEDEDDGTD